MKILFLFLLLPIYIYSFNTIAIVGDSVSNGFEVKSEECFVNLLQKRYHEENKDIHVINRSFNGATTGTGKPIVFNLLAIEKPDYIVIFLGINDVGRKIPPEKLKHHFVSMVEMACFNCKKVILGGIDCLDEKYNIILAEIYQYLIEVYDVYPTMLFGPDVKATNPGGHPSAEGHQIIADNLYNVFHNLGLY